MIITQMLFHTSTIICLSFERLYSLACSTPIIFSLQSIIKQQRYNHKVAFILRTTILMKISLIQTSQNRKSELARFVTSLNGQDGIDFCQIQLIFIDQEENKQVFDELDERIEFIYIKYHHCSLSHARNIGIRKATGDFVAFPDDDCWYEPDTLSEIFKSLVTSIDGIIAKGTNEKGQLTNIFPSERKTLTKCDRCGAISYTIFVRLDKSVLFDEKLGVGSPYGLGAGEETDYLLRLMEEKGFILEYNPNIIVHHPSFAPVINKRTLDKIKSYSRGNGYLLRKHKFPITYVLKQFIRPMIGSVFYLLKGNSRRSQHSFNILVGRVQGYFYKG